MIPAIGLALGILIGLLLQPAVPVWLQPYLPIAVIAALDAVFGAVRAILDGIFDDKVFVVSFLSNVVVAAFIVFLGDKLGVGAQLSTGVVVVLGVRIFSNVASIRRHDEHLCRLFLEITDSVRGLTVYGPRDLRRRAGVFSVAVEHLEAGDLADRLESDYGVLTRPGIHCAPLAHRTIGTMPGGTCRLSFGPFTSEAHVRHAAAALREIATR